MEKLKTTLTVTYHDSDNYGSVLQSYALQNAIKNMGFENEIIDYRKDAVAEVYKLVKPIHSRYDLLSDIYNMLHLKSLKLGKERYEDFRTNCLNLTETKYSTFEQLKKSPPSAQCYITGSDQVWNSGIGDFDETYLLQFTNNGRKISYAASGITEKTPEKDISMIANSVKEFDAVSVRENIAKKRLKEVAGLESERVLDPVLLIDQEEWNKLTYDYSKNSPYMVCYFAGGVSKAFEKYTYDLAKKLGLKRVLLMPEWRNFFKIGKKSYDSGPKEFLSLIKYASFVCTNSFHGTAFSIIFNKPFQVGLHIPFKEDRIKTLLELCELTDREIDPKVAKIDESCLNINYKQANMKLEFEKKRCKEWLKQALTGEQ
jgi:hypothetical protein